MLVFNFNNRFQNNNIFPLTRQTYIPRIMKRKLKVMVSNSTNINKTNTHLSPQTIEHKKKTMTYGIGNPVLVWALKCVRLNRFMESQPLYDNWIFNDRYQQTIKKPPQIPCHCKDHTLSQNTMYRIIKKTTHFPRIPCIEL